MSDAWTTVEQIDAKRAEFEQALGASWRRPAVWAVAHEADGQIAVDRVNVGEGYLPAAVLATVVGGGSA